ncbi:MAG: glycosyltransferase [Acholeplasmataceae bacterium]|nr:glycosyltransferase [Acholeplasmataceae bacterium]
MVIVFVIDNYKNLSNGTNITAYRFTEALKKLGHEIRIVSNDVVGQDIYTLKTRHIPIVSYVAKKQGVTFSKPNKKVLEEALQGADIVHLITPWKTSKMALKIAKKMNIPVTTAFHVPPESIIYGAKLRFLNWPLKGMLYRRFRRFFKNVKHVHCPSSLTAAKLKSYQYPNQFHVISNGVSCDFKYFEPQKDKEHFNIIAIGRFAHEKRQEIIIKAIGKSQYRDKIILTLAGIGPTKDRLVQLAKRLKVNVEFGFYSKDDLIEKISQQDLYIHASDIEIEGISCLEAIACGRVPLIANAKNSASVQFVLDERSLFAPGDVEDLKEKMEYWLTNDQERHKMELEYAKSSEKYSLLNSVNRFEDMVREAIVDHKNNLLATSKRGKPIRKTIKKGRVEKTLTTAFYYIVVPLLMAYNKAYLKAKINNKHHLKKIKGGAVIVSNHVHTLDSVMSGLAAFPKKVVFTAIKANFKKPVVGQIVRALGTVPTPESITENRIFFNELSKKARNGKFIHFFPEGELIEGDKNIRQFKRGAFKLAVESSVPIVPIRINIQERRNSKNKIKERMIVNIGKPIFPDYTLSPKRALESLKFETEEAMNKLLN